MAVVLSTDSHDSVDSLEDDHCYLSPHLRRPEDLLFQKLGADLWTSAHKGARNARAVKQQEKQRLQEDNKRLQREKVAAEEERQLESQRVLALQARLARSQARLAALGKDMSASEEDEE